MHDDFDDDGFDDDDWLDEEGDDDSLVCPACGAEVHVESEACPACGYWITEADRSAAWRTGSASGRIITIGLLLIAAAVLVWLAGVLG